MHQKYIETWQEYLIEKNRRKTHWLNQSGMSGGKMRGDTCVV